MLSRADNERLTRVGPGTPMGETMRRYWMPAVLSWELPEPDCAPVRVRLLGEDLVAFRTTDGKVGLLEEFCPHRRTSLWLGRNEANGLRCVYHGWKYDITGQCVDQMNEPRQFCDKIRAVAYPTCELGGVIWAYMGPSEKQPAPPKFEWTQLPETHRAVSKVVEDCNWLQALEGGIDTSHFTILHRALKKGAVGIDPQDVGVKGGAPTLEVDVTDYGYRYFGVRPLGEELYVRGYHFVMPFTQLRPPGPGRQEVHGHYWVPMDDETCMVWNFYWSYGTEPIGDRASEERSGNAYGSQVDISNGFRPIRNRSNDWLIDRQKQKTETFSGIHGVNQQDRAVQESMGPIVDRSRENLGPADRAVVATRRLLLEATEAVERNEDPRGVSPAYYEARAAEAMQPKAVDWREVLLPLMYPQTGGKAAADGADRRRTQKVLQEAVPLDGSR
ncbi:MAG TPA: Rieske 2Fe-2S domain-containing protein [Stellaceae bacterium]|nr:Rieske 2Fe-2S domain-containing protein [Stellaceae bacterium]